MSTHSIPVIKIETIKKHPNADALEIVEIDGFQCITRLGEFKPGELAIYIEPDYLVPLENPLFSFLKSNRIKTKKLRGEWSMGLLIKPTPEMNVKEGDNVMELLGIERYIPGESFVLRGSEIKPPPLAFLPAVYDIENVRKYKTLIKPDEEVVITEKIHGCNAKFVRIEEDPYWYAGSRTQWKNDKTDVLWWQILKTNQMLATYCEYNPGMVVFGEIYGSVQDLKYGAHKNQNWFRAFDIWDSHKGKFVDYDMFKSKMDEYHIETVPEIYRGPFDYNKVLELAEGKSLLYPTQIREGVVVKTTTEKYGPKFERLILKAVSNAYLER